MKCLEIYRIKLIFYCNIQKTYMKSTILGNINPDNKKWKVIVEMNRMLVRERMKEIKRMNAEFENERKEYKIQIDRMKINEKERCNFILKLINEKDKMKTEYEEQIEQLKRKFTLLKKTLK